MNAFFEPYERQMADHLAGTPHGPCDRAEVATAAAYWSAVQTGRCLDRVAKANRDLWELIEQAARESGLRPPAE